MTIYKNLWSRWCYISHLWRKKKHFILHSTQFGSFNCWQFVSIIQHNTWYVEYCYLCNFLLIEHASERCWGSLFTLHSSCTFDIFDRKMFYMGRKIRIQFEEHLNIHSSPSELWNWKKKSKHTQINPDVDFMHQMIKKCMFRKPHFINQWYNHFLFCSSISTLNSLMTDPQTIRNLITQINFEFILHEQDINNRKIVYNLFKCVLFF